MRPAVVRPNRRKYRKGDDRMQARPGVIGLRFSVAQAAPSGKLTTGARGINAVTRPLRGAEPQAIVHAVELAFIVYCLTSGVSVDGPKR